MTRYEPVTDRQTLVDIVADAVTFDAYALDTEFHRERTYYPKVALVQLAYGDRLHLIDPLEVDLAPLSTLLEGPGLAVLHAASQDLEVFMHACGTITARLFDTQIGAGFLGMSSPSLAALHDQFLSLKLTKGDRLTDWLARPLTEKQLEYAAADVTHLLEIYDLIATELEARGRLEWAAAECELARLKGAQQRDPDEAWLKIKDTRHLRSKARGVAKAVAAWRERRAATIDQPPRFVLPDLAVVAMAQSPPTKAADLRRIRGLDERHRRQIDVDELLAAVSEGVAAPPEQTQQQPRKTDDKALRPAVALVAAWLAQFARDIEMDPALIGTRSDIEALLRDDPDARMSEGWRADVVGGTIKRLVAGDASVAFERGGRLTVEERSRKPLEAATMIVARS